MAHWYDIYFGWFYLVLGLSYCLKANDWLALVRQMMEDQKLLQVWWIIFLGAGLWIIAIHNVWVWQWHVAVTILGWSLAIKSVIYMLYPQAINRFAGLSDAAMLAWIRGAGLVTALVGLILIW